MQKHMQRALTENKDWGSVHCVVMWSKRFVFGVIEIVRGKRPAHERETELINTLELCIEHIWSQMMLDIFYRIVKYRYYYSECLNNCINEIPLVV
jgi:hypothetical protein